MKLVLDIRLLGSAVFHLADDNSVVAVLACGQTPCDFCAAMNTICGFMAELFGWSREDAGMGDRKRSRSVFGEPLSTLLLTARVERGELIVCGGSLKIGVSAPAILA
ncbi:hypothetical protein [Glaciimonas immobilis]|uniref:Uncharacterized protein n=1 Tax=Glaciimonas immobilis TaxID=728004 RepID=A0A840RXR8_9BURK|nr:hypothetical protein [Glaciimonas immobilis]KAF3998383.1 hypothetical protein HAV38_09300 [Glaciimonas immobilis]MBB5202012.1 hypothetical protein [Glaciimonas immobilis]